MLIYNILAEGSLAGAGKSVTLPVSVKSSDKEREKVSYLLGEPFITEERTKDNIEGGGPQKGFIREKTDSTGCCAAQSKYDRPRV